VRVRVRPLWLPLVVIAWTAIVGLSFAWTLDHTRSVVPIGSDQSTAHSAVMVLPSQGAGSDGSDSTHQDRWQIWHAGVWLVGLIVAFGSYRLDVRRQRERRQAEEGLRKLSSAVEQSPVSIVITDVAGTIEYVNPKFTSRTGYALDEAVGQNPRILKSGSRSPDEYREMWHTISSGREWRGEFLNKAKDGTLFWEHAVISPIRDQQGAITHYVAVKEDITDRKQLEAQLLQAMKLESVGRLAGGVAHDFNNMLQAILGHAQIALAMLPVDHPVYADLVEIERAGMRSADLTRQLLAFARRQPASLRVVDLNEAVQGTRRMLERLIGEDIELVCRLGPEVWPVRIDPSHLDQVLTNLALNSRDAVVGGGTITIETSNLVIDEVTARQWADARPGEFVRLAVHDTGAGMDADTLARVFEPFFTTKSLGRGTGLGLATVYGVIKQNDGFIAAASTPGRGSTFAVYLPHAEEEAVDGPATIEAVALPDHGTEHVLVVEDDGGVLRLARMFLEQLGYAVTTFRSPVEALEFAESDPPRVDLLITDVVMPVLNGDELSRRLQARWPHLRVLFMSGYTSDVILERGAPADAVRLLQKPFTREVLAARVRSVLDAGEAGPQPRPTGP
jgi:PAS domain S-box-containing protein